MTETVADPKALRSIFRQMGYLLLSAMRSLDRAGLPAAMPSSMADTLLRGSLIIPPRPEERRRAASRRVSSGLWRRPRALRRPCGPPQHEGCGAQRMLSQPLTIRIERDAARAHPPLEGEGRRCAAAAGRGECAKRILPPSWHAIALPRNFHPTPDLRIQEPCPPAEVTATPWRPLRIVGGCVFRARPAAAPERRGRV